MPEPFPLVCYQCHQSQIPQHRVRWTGNYFSSTPTWEIVSKEMALHGLCLSFKIHTANTMQTQMYNNYTILTWYCVVLSGDGMRYWNTLPTIAQTSGRIPLLLTTSMDGGVSLGWHNCAAASIKVMGSSTCLMSCWFIILDPHKVDMTGIKLRSASVLLLIKLSGKCAGVV